MTEVGFEKQVELRGLPQAVSDELVKLYFENSRRSGGGPLQGWQRLGIGGILTFQKSEDAQRVLAQASHELQGTAVSVVPSPPRASQRLLLQGLRPGTAPQLLELYVESLLSAEGHCQALDSPRPDRALVQLSTPLSEAEFEELAARASEKTLNGAAVSLAWVPQARAVRIVRRDRPPDATLLQLYLENECRSGGGALEGLRTLPRAQGTVVTFQQWEVAERVLSRNHQLSDSELSIVPHYDVLEPEPEPEPESKPAEGERPALGETTSQETSGEKVLRETCGKTAPLESPEGTVPLEKPEVTVPPGKSVTVERKEALEPLPGLVLEETMPVERSKETTEDTVSKRVVPEEREEELAKTVVPVQLLLSMEPGALRFLQLYYQEFLASLEEVTLYPLDGPDVTGFRLSGALEPCHAAKDFLQSLLISIGCHTLPLKHPGSASFLLGSEGQDLLRNLEAQFHCILTVEEQGVAALDADPVELDPIDQESLSDWTHNSSPPRSTVQNISTIQIEKIKEFLAAFDGPDEEELPSLELKEAELDEFEETVAAPDREKTTLEEEADLQLALHHSLEAEALMMGETRALKQALMMSLLDDIEANSSSGKLVVHSTFDHDPSELSHALETALRAWLQEERVMGVDQGLPPTFWSRLERHHGVTITLQGDCAILSGYGPQPSCAAQHLKTLMTVPLNQSHTVAPDPARAKVVAQVTREQPLELERLEESSVEFQETAQAFYNTLDKPHNVHIIKLRTIPMASSQQFYARLKIKKEILSLLITMVERVSQPLLQSQYELHKKKLEQTCSSRPVERILYHGTSWQAVPDICSQGFNRSFCGRNAAMYGNGVYFAVKAKISVKDRYSPPDRSGHKAVFVARVLTGDYGPGHPGLQVPPQKESGRGVQRYDSAVDSTKKPRIFVIFHDTQALPIFLITCQHIPASSLPHGANCSGFDVPWLHPPI